ncbi:hypothetical protein GMRT_10570 [Giardia muris]|uniref:Uncharacterized protein n=1 Tax=Giardia muris TaxID=5742 RepID=A0A4Z1T364_GIAMU|nr:hypothetical protein GMRT_10570 [Giardia muris]|eukprot:TNJ26851.1 hypothetical protein GMRT_10570 [Giardia muris]
MPNLPKAQLLSVSRLGRVPGLVTCVGYARRLYVGTLDGSLFAIDRNLEARRVRRFSSTILFLLSCETASEDALLAPSIPLLIICQNGEGVVMDVLGRQEDRILTLDPNPKCRPVFPRPDRILLQQGAAGTITNVLAARPSSGPNEAPDGYVLLGGLTVSSSVVFYGEGALLHVYDEDGGAEGCRPVDVILPDGLAAHHEALAIISAARYTEELVAFGTNSGFLLLVRVAELLAPGGRSVTSAITPTQTDAIQALLPCPGGLLVLGSAHLEHVTGDAGENVVRVCLLDSPSVGGGEAVICTRDGDLVELVRAGEEE